MRSTEPTTLELTGEVCPFTFARTKLALEALPLGAALVVTVDHEPARRNVPRSAAELARTSPRWPTRAAVAGAFT